MDPRFAVVVGAIIAITFMLTTAGVILLRPITKHLGAYLRALTEERSSRGKTGEPPLEAVLQAMTRLEQRLRAVEERQDFSEELFRARRSDQALPAPGRDS